MVDFISNMNNGIQNWIGGFNPAVRQAMFIQKESGFYEAKDWVDLVLVLLIISIPIGYLYINHRKEQKKTKKKQSFLSVFF